MKAFEPAISDDPLARQEAVAAAGGGFGESAPGRPSIRPRKPTDADMGPRNWGGGEFDNIDDVVPRAERNDFMAKYKAAAGFAIEQLNNAPPTIASGLRVSSAVGA